MKPDLKPIKRFFKPPEVPPIPETLAPPPYPTPDFSTLEGSAFPPYLLEGNLANVALTNVYAIERQKTPWISATFSVSKGVFYLHEQTLWYGPSFSATLPDEPPHASTSTYQFPTPSSHTHLAFGTPYPFNFPIPIDAPATLVQAGRHWPVVQRKEVTVRRIVRDEVPQDCSAYSATNLSQTLSASPAKFEPLFKFNRPSSPPPVNRRRRTKTKERHRSTGRPDDELLVSSVHSISMTLGQRCHINTLDRFRPPHPTSLSHGTLGMWEDNATTPIAMPSIYMGDSYPPSPLRPPPPLPRHNRRHLQNSTHSPPPHVQSNPHPSPTAPSAPSTPLPSKASRNLHTAGQTVSTRPGEYKFLKVPVGRGVGSRHVNGIGGNRVASPPLMAGDRSRRNSLAVIAEGVGNVNKMVGDGEGGGECFVGVEVMLGASVQASVIQQNLKSDKKSILGTGQKKLATIEIPVFVVHGAPPAK
ncbi:hypothetical protein BC829DRAFT_488798 [Chytridium lagenaria]|nr:hypothetical protein BC829DRAFT_488798 [Chytridium lagenaria]